jgi:hypothetical protein
MNIHGRVVIGALVMWCSAVPVEAQAPAPAPAGEHPEARRPHDALFGSGTEKPDDRASLLFEVSGYGGHDDNVVSEESSGQPLFGLPGEFLGGRAALNYVRAGRNLSFALGGESTFRYLAIRQSDTVGAGSLSATMAGQLSRKWQLRVAERAGYTSFFLFTPASDITGPDPNDVASGIDLAVARRPAYTTGSLASLTRTVGRRSALSLELSGRSTALVASRERFIDYGGGINYQHPVSRNATLHVGYGLHRASNRLIADDAQIDMHDIDAGVSYEGRPGFSRRTHLAFSTGSAVIRRSAGLPERTFVHLTGSATASHQIGRTWAIHAGYNRGAQFVHVIPGVFSSHAASAGVTGVLARRLELSVDGSYSTGTLSFQIFDDPLMTYQGGARLRTALTRSLAFDVSYLYYRYSFDGHGARSELERDVRRNALRAGLTLRLASGATRGRS